VAKWYLTERDSDKALALRDDFATGHLDITIPSLLYYEVANALRFSGAYSIIELKTAAVSLSKYAFEVWQPRGRLLEDALDLSLGKEITVYDACYVALAQRKRVSLCTEDAELLSKFPETAVSLKDLKLPT
jgi:predicted nucleic acid-binding protein